MPSALLTLLLATTALSHIAVCAERTQLPLEVSGLPIKLNRAFTFKIVNYESRVSIIKSPKGTLFNGNFSRLLLNVGGSVHQYIATSFTFRYPPQHRVSPVGSDVLEMQVKYLLVPGGSLAWKHKTIVLSVSYVVTDYAPTQGFSISQQLLNNPLNGSTINFKKLVPLVSGLNMLIYKGIHSEQPENKAFLWMVRTQLLLISRQQFDEVRQMLGGNEKAHQETHGLVNRLSDLNQIEETREDIWKSQTNSNEL